MAQEKFVGCSVRDLPKEQQIQAAAMAKDINPANAPNLRGAAFALVDEPAKIAALTGKYWGPGGQLFKVAFMEKTAKELAEKIVHYMNVWSKNSSVKFVWTTDLTNAQIRVSRKTGGYWSYLGTDILSIPINKPTMNLEAFTLRTPDYEYARVVTHEAGHSLGFPHEHMRGELIAKLDKERTISYFRRTQGWSSREVVQQVLTPLSERSLLSTPADQDSVMCYQIPGECTKDRKPIRGGIQPTPNDLAFNSKIYPPVVGSDNDSNVLLTPLPESIPTRKHFVINAPGSVRITLESDAEISIHTPEN